MYAVCESCAELDLLQRFRGLLAGGRPAGHQGLTVSRLNIEFVSARLLTLFQQAFWAFSVPPFYEVTIVVLHKPGKPPDQWGSNRPNRLINLAAKILTRIPAMRLASVISSLVGTDQSGKTTDIVYRSPGLHKLDFRNMHRVTVQVPKYRS